MLTYAEDLAGRNAVQADYLGMQGVREGPGEVDERLKDQARLAGNLVVVRRFVVVEAAQSHIVIGDDLKGKRPVLSWDRMDLTDFVHLEVEVAAEEHHLFVAKEALSAVEVVRVA